MINVKNNVFDQITLYESSVNVTGGAFVHNFEETLAKILRILLVAESHLQFHKR